MRDSVRLSEDRAIAVKNYLVMKKIFPGRIKIKGFGPTSPLPGYPRQSPENRRTEIRIIDTNWDPKREIMPNMAFVDFSAKMEKKNNPLNYLKISLPESIHTSLSNIGYLHKKFPRENWISDLDEIKNNKFNRFASRFGLDYIIFGEFQELSDMLIIYPKIYKAKNDKIIELNAFTTATGPDLFQDIDNLSRVIEKELDK
jgi:hypothetical protein